MKIIIIGATGMLGTDILHEAKRKGLDVVGFGSKDIDISNPGEISKQLDALGHIAFVINAAAYTQVDACEDNQDLAMSVNGTGPGHLAAYCNSRNIRLVHFSTDYVFDGQKKGAYLESDTPSPINVYGDSKLEGERQIQAQLDSYYIFRVQWLYGHNGSHFVKSISQLARDRDELKIVDDQWGSPTWTLDIAKDVLDFIVGGHDFGIYNYASSNVCNWYQFAQEIVSLQGIDCKVGSQPSSAYPRPANRPENSRLDLSKYVTAANQIPRTWKASLSEFLAQSF